jgi:hypothetical protein
VIPTQVDVLTERALAVGLAALRNYGPEAALRAMAGWLPLIERATTKMKKANHV